MRMSSSGAEGGSNRGALRNYARQRRLSNNGPSHRPYEKTLHLPNLIKRGETRKKPRHEVGKKVPSNRYRRTKKNVECQVERWQGEKR